MRQTVVLAFVLACLPAQAAVRNDFFGIEFKTGREYLKDFTQEQLAVHLQRFADQVYRKGFRYLGDAEDSDHGHILYVAGHGGRPVPIAILYHTQEGASKARKNDPGGKYDYLDAKGRNWIQWLDPNRPVENAARYARQSYPDTPRWRGYMENIRGYQEAGTVISIMLNPGLIGGPVVIDAQWTFRRTDCATGAAGVVEIHLSGGETACLRFSP